MNDVLEREISGAPVTVPLRGMQFPLRYSLHAVILYKQRTGDSLFVKESFAKIDLQTDPERWLACLWAGLHAQNDEGEWRCPFARIEDLEAAIDFSNAGDISVLMVRALTQSMPKAKAEEPDPNVAAPAAEPTAPEAGSPTPIETSPGTTLAPVAALASTAVNS